VKAADAERVNLERTAVHAPSHSASQPYRGKTSMCASNPRARIGCRDLSLDHSIAFTGYRRLSHTEENNRAKETTPIQNKLRGASGLLITAFLSFGCLI
jgi:hypothetical protein